MSERKKPGPKGPAKGRFQLVIPIETLIEVRRMAGLEDRSVSSMLAVLVKEAIQARKERESGQWAPQLRAA